MSATRKRPLRALVPDRAILGLAAATALVACSLFGGSGPPEEVRGEMDGLERALAQHPADAVARRRLADLCYEYGDDEGADRHYRLLVEGDPLGPQDMGEIAQRYRKMGETFGWDVSRHSEDVDEAKERAYKEYAGLLEGRARFLSGGGAPSVSARIGTASGDETRLGRVMAACTNRFFESGPPGSKRLAWTTYGDQLPLLDAARRRGADSSDYSLAEIALLRITPRLGGEPALLEVTVRPGVETAGRCAVCVLELDCSLAGDREGGGLQLVPLLSAEEVRFAP